MYTFDSSSSKIPAGESISLSLYRRIEYFWRVNSYSNYIDLSGYHGYTQSTYSYKVYALPEYQKNCRSAQLHAVQFFSSSLRGG